MNKKYFLDTGILISSFGTSGSAKTALARELICQAVQSGAGCISWQVVQEFLKAAIHNFRKPLSPTEAKTYLRKVLEPLCEIYPEPELYESALDIQVTTGYSAYESLIIASALKSECRVLYSEEIRGDTTKELEIKDPFYDPDRTIILN